MRDLTFHYRALEKELVTRDFARDRALGNPARRAMVVGEAVETATKGFSNPLALRTSSLRGKRIHQPVQLSDQLILRLVTRNIRRLTGVRQSNRESIIRSLQVILTEGIDYRVYKIDVQSFYETVNTDALMRQLTADQAFPRDSLRILRTFFSQMSALGVQGLPRGVALSATLSEYVMRAFDETVRAQPGVYFYSRFVDDVLVLTTGQEDPREFLGRIRKALFEGLKLNAVKTRYIDIRNVAKGSNGLLAASFDFLGYQFNVHERTRINQTILRKVKLDIAPRKVKRIKTRIVKSLLVFLEDKNFDDLHDRLRLLTGNYNLYDESKQLRRNSGLYCNYRLVDLSDSKSLPDLDRFLKALVLSKKGVFDTRLVSALSKSQKRQVLKISFSAGFQARVFYHFSPDRLHHLMSCWAYA